MSGDLELRAARIGDQVSHGLGMVGLLSGALAGAAMGAAMVAAGAATGGLALVAIVRVRSTALMPER